MGVGNLPALERPGPRRRGICLIRESEDRKASYLRASFLISFLFLLSFFRSSEDMASTPACLARSISCWSPRTLQETATLAPCFLPVLAFSCQPRNLVCSLRKVPKMAGLDAYQMLIPGRGTVGSLMVPEKRLSRWGSTYMLGPVPGQPGGMEKERTPGAAFVTKHSGFAPVRFLGTQGQLHAVIFQPACTLEPVPGEPEGKNKESTLGAACLTKHSGFAGTVL